uniref:Putative membrane protein n=2 Tax=Vibrio parahaemolyticus TaxID=670 RepID=A0A5P4S7N6_VIBPH|nr:putative membrane protein [Vibrio parahaemolyticus]QOS16129.1 hypothetical protein VP33_00015 [Vibrio parahaemolyticus]
MSNATVTNGSWIYPRRAFIILYCIFFFVLYAVRFFTLDYNDRSLQFYSHGYRADLSQIDLSIVLVWFISGLLVSLFVPRKSWLQPSFALIRFLKFMFYFETFMLIVVIFIGVKSGSDQNIIQKGFLFFVYSMVPLNFVFFSLLVSNECKAKHVLMYVIPTILIASKSGMIFALVMYLTSRMLLKKTILSPKVIFILLSVVLAYPVLIVSAGLLRNGQFSILNLYEGFFGMGSNVYELYMITLTSISRRISGLDVLFIPLIPDNETFSFLNLLLFSLKGLLTAGLVDSLTGMPSFGLGRYFAIEYFNQPIELANGFEPTMFGIIYHTSDKILVSILLMSLSVSPFLIFRFRNTPLSLLYMSYFIFSLMFIVMTGIVAHLPQVFRFYFLTAVLFYIAKRIRF